MPPRAPLLSERTDFLEGDAPAAAKGLVPWETAQDIAAVKAPGVQKNSTPSLTQKQAIALLEAIPSDTSQGIRDLALMSVFFLTGCRVSACVGHLETDGVEHYLNVTETPDRGSSWRGPESPVPGRGRGRDRLGRHWARPDVRAPS